MRRLLRILLYFIAVFSLLLCAATLVLWVRGYWSTDRLIRSHVWRVGAGVKLRNVDVIAQRGRVTLCVRHIHDDGALNNNDTAYSLLLIADVTRGEPAWRHLKDPVVGLPYLPLWKPLEWKRDQRSLPPRMSDVSRVVDLADWAVVGLSGILPAAVFWKWKRALSQRNQGLCPTCDYDLRATPDRCPECGAVPTTR